MAKYIDADELIKKLKTDTNMMLDDVCTVEDTIDDMPAADVEHVRCGRWIFVFQTRYNTAYKCSECGKMVTGDNFYCPRCGAKMIEVGDDAR